MIRTLLIALLVSVGSIASGAAQTGPDYVFNVPVRIENTPALVGRRFAVSCQVFARTSDGRLINFINTDGLSAHPTWPIGPSGFHDTIRIEITLPAGVRRADVTSWTCDAQFYDLTNSAGAVVPFSSPAHYTVLTGQAVSRAVLSVGSTFAP